MECCSLARVRHQLNGRQDRVSLYLCRVPLSFSLLAGRVFTGSFRPSTWQVMACSSTLLSSLWPCVYRELQALYLADDGLFLYPSLFSLPGVYRELQTLYLAVDDLFLYPSLFSLSVCLLGASGPLPGR